MSLCGSLGKGDKDTEGLPSPCPNDRSLNCPVTRVLAPTKPYLCTPTVLHRYECGKSWQQRSLNRVTSFIVSAVCRAVRQKGAAADRSAAQLLLPLNYLCYTTTYNVLTILCTRTYMVPACVQCASASARDVKRYPNNIVPVHCPQIFECLFNKQFSLQAMTHVFRFS